MLDITDWITAIASLVAASGVGFVAYQASLAKSSLEQSKSSLSQAAESIDLLRISLESDHERSRRENAAILIMKWSVEMKWEASLARKLVEKLSRDETKKLYDWVPFSIDERYRNLVDGCLSQAQKPNLEIENGKINLTDKQSAHISWLVLSYLNLLESILVSWQNGIADAEMIKSEFKYLVNPNSNKFILHHYRTVKEGVNNYPAIQAFVTVLKNEHENKIKHRGVIS